MSKGDLRISPKDLLTMKEIPHDFPRPSVALMCYQHETIDTAMELGYQRISGKLTGDLYIKPGGRVAISKPHGIGSPVAAMVVEELSALGVNALVEFGTAGSLQRFLEFGDCIICDQALRGEGTSLYYQHSGRFCKPNLELLKEAQEIIPASVGTVWTTDAPYRETVQNITHYSNLGFLGVNMETSAVYAVCKALKIRAISICVVSDNLLLKDFKYLPFKTSVALRNISKKIISWLESMDNM